MNATERKPGSVTDRLRAARQKMGSRREVKARPRPRPGKPAGPAMAKVAGPDIFGLHQEEGIRETVKKTKAHFAGRSPASRLYYDRLQMHSQLESAISTFNGYAHSHLFLNTSMATQALIETCCRNDLNGFIEESTKRTLILVDQHNYAAFLNVAGRVRAMLHDRYSLSGNTDLNIIAYKHADPADLEKQFKKSARSDDRIVVFTEAVFPEEGTVAPLLGLISVLSDFPGSILVIDETNSAGILGPHGKGIFDYFDIDGKTAIELGIEPVSLTAFTRFAGSFCAAVSSDNERFVALLDAATTSSDTSSFPAPENAKVLDCIDHLKKHPELREKLIENADYIRAGLQSAGWDTSGFGTAIISVNISNRSASPAAAALSEDFHFRVIPVDDKISRLNMLANAKYTQSQMDRLISVLNRIKEDRRT